jgi:amino acid adenylation domain-containing protein
MLIERFEEQVKTRPDKVAVKSGKSTLTYGFLNQCANHLAAALPGLYEKHCLAALLLGHDESMIVGILGILKAGGVYIPFDPTYPEERLLYMLGDSKARLIITNKENIDFASRLKERISTPISILDLDEMDFNQPVKDVNLPVKPREAAYILYTSGSTGKPRGVIQTRQNICYYIENWRKRFSLSISDRLALLAPFCHDGSVPDIYGALLNGASLYPFDIKRATHTHNPGQWLTREQITTWHSVPTLFRYFVNTLDKLAEEEFFPHLRLVVLGGEPVRNHDIMMFEKHFPGAAFANIYGQTESTVSSIWLKAGSEESPSVFIGEPVGQTEILIVDEQGNEMDTMEIGEIVLGSAFLSPGYLNDSEATRRVFMTDEEFGRLYWTGDQGRQLPDGNIEIMGRKDFQVKIRGFRIELGEIESMLMQHPHIREAVVKPGGPTEESEDNYLCAYFVSHREFQVSELREYLAGKLPGYMIPAYFLQVDNMPLTTTGKIDRKALDALGKKVTTGVQYTAPSTEAEKMLVNIWQEVLGVDRVGVHDNFFDLGGNSMKVIRMHNRLKEDLNLNIPAVMLYQHMTVSTFARYLTRAEVGINRLESKAYHRSVEVKKGRNRLRKRIQGRGAINEGK